MTYDQLLQSKQRRVEDSGFECGELHEQLFPFQKFCVKTALKKGRYALFQDCGLGKTFQQIEWAQKVAEYTNKPVLIIAPLVVVAQTVSEGIRFGYHITAAGTGNDIEITNYEQLENVDCSVYGGVVLDESSILKNFEGAYRNLIIELFKDTPYKLACTATPSPNDPMELGNHAEFLNVMSRNEMLAMFFVHDGGETSKWRIKGHAEKDFWRFVSSWAVMVSMPSDIGFSNEGYNLPGLNFIEHKIVTQSRNTGGYFNTVAVSATNFNTELRITKLERLEYAADIVNKSDESFLIWIKQNPEGEYLLKAIPDSIEVKGSDDNEYKKAALLAFAQGKHRVLITKSKIAGYGMNFQNCHNQVHPSLDFSFESLYQSLRRSYRFGQMKPVNIYIITTDTMQNVIESIKRKQKQFEQMQQSMQLHMNEVFNETHERAPESRVIKTDKYELRRGDCIHEIKSVPDESWHFSIFSPPFAELYTYSNHIEDMGNSKDYKEFLVAFSFLVKELYRVIKPGRNVAVHCMDLPIQKGKEGYIGLRDFSGMILRSFCGITEDEARLIDEAKTIINECESLNETTGLAYQMFKSWVKSKEDFMQSRGGFIYHTRVTIWKNPVTEMQRTKALGLLHKQVKKDATMSRVGIPDYLLVFRKPGENENPVKCTIDVDTWQKYASPVWMDIDYGDTLNGRQGREDADEKHIAPLQLQTIRRAIILWTNKNETVGTPFLGVGSEVYEAVKMGRLGWGAELKESYFDLAVKNCADAALSAEQKTFFDL